MGDTLSKPDPMNVVFAKVMYFMAIFCIAVIILSGTAYILGVNQYVSIPTVIRHWDEVAEKFWMDIKGYEVNGYMWFLGNLGYSDNICVLGIALLATTPFVSLAAAIFKSDKYYKFIFLLLIVEFIIAILFR